MKTSLHARPCVIVFLHLFAISGCELDGVYHHFAFWLSCCCRPLQRLSAVVRCCLSVLPSAIASSLSPVCDVGVGAGNAGRF